MAGSLNRDAGFQLPPHAQPDKRYVIRGERKQQLHLLLTNMQHPYLFPG